MLALNNSAENIISFREKFQTYFPGGHSNLKQYPNSMHTIIARAEGSKIWDLDGTEYLDYVCGYGPNILGHHYPEYINSLKRAMDTLPMCIGPGFASSINDVAVAERLVAHIPCAERVKFSTTGTEAVQTAMRIARAFTGRPYVLKFDSHYHGWIDTIFAFGASVEREGKPFASATKDYLGHAPGAEEGVLMIEWNNISALEDTLEKCGEEIAMIIMEPFASNGGGCLPRPGYLDKARELCDRHGVVLCFDEVLTGFRVGLNSAQGLYGVTPDLTTLGKAIGGGMPISAVVGRAKVMDVLKEGKTMCAGTYSGHFICVQAMLSTLQILERDGGAVYANMENVQKKLMAGLDEIARRRGVPARVQGLTGLFVMLFGCDPDKVHYSGADGRTDEDLSFRFWKLLQDQGVMPAVNRWLLNIVHTDDDTEIVLEAADKAMAYL